MTVSPPTRADVDRITAAARRYGAPADVAEAAARNLVSGTAQLHGVSGKMGSGKNTIAPVILELCGVRDAVEHSFAFPLKNQLENFISDVRFWAEHISGLDPRNMSDGARDSLARFLAEQHDFPVAQAREFFTGDFATEVLTDPTVTSRTRTHAMRKALQNLGTDVRRAQDDLYWVKLAVVPMVEVLAAGRSVFYTDSRFPNEMDSVRELGGLASRLDVTEETQRIRLHDRDGLTVTEEALRHTSETALDDYPHFDVRVPNDGRLEDTIVAIMERLRQLGRLHDAAPVLV